MATQQEKAELAVLKDQMNRANEDIKEIKETVKEGFNGVNQKLDNMPDLFITRREGNVLRTLIGILLAAVSSIAAIMAVKGGH